MIKSLRIKNFQSHKESSLVLDEGVNVIVGPSDQGKSAIIRALRWALRNDQQGEAFRRHGSKETSVMIILKDKQEVKRMRSNKDNSYTLDDLEFDKVRGDVPEEIAKILNIDDINVQAQMDAPFLLAESPAEVGRILNRAVSMEEIDTSMTKIASMERENNKELAIRKADLEEVTQDLKRFKGLDELDGKAIAAEKGAKGVNAIQKQIKAVSGLLISLKDIQNSIDQVQSVAIIDLKGVLELKTQHETTITQIDSIEGVIKKLKSIENKSKKASKIANQEQQIEKAIQLDTELRKNKQDVKLIEQLMEELDELHDDVIDTERLKEKAEADFRKLMPDECPLCGK